MDDLDFSAYGLRPVGRRSGTLLDSKSSGGTSPLEACPRERNVADDYDGGASPLQSISVDAGVDDSASVGGSSSGTHARELLPVVGPSMPLSVHGNNDGSGVSALSASNSNDILFWAFNVSPHSVATLQRQCVFHQAMAMVQRRLSDAADKKKSSPFQLRSSLYCSFHFAFGITNKHVAVFEHAVVKLVPRELLLFGDCQQCGVDHLIVTFDPLDDSMKHLLSDNMPLYAVLGTCDLLCGYRTSRRAMQELVDQRRANAAKMLGPTGKLDPMPVAHPFLEKGVVGWRCSRFVVETTLTKHMRGEFSV